MKKLLWMAVVLAAGAVSCPAETIDEVYYNPSRLGHYDYFTVTHTLDTKGAVQAKKMNISGNSVTIRASTFTIDNLINIKNGEMNFPNSDFNLTNLTYGLKSKADFNGEGYIRTVDTEQAWLEANTLNLPLGNGVYISNTFKFDGVFITLPGDDACDGSLGFTERQISGGSKYFVLGCQAHLPQSGAANSCIWDWTNDGGGTQGSCNIEPDCDPNRPCDEAHEGEQCIDTVEPEGGGVCTVNYSTCTCN